ncbi:MAG: putative sulfate exporter family transporter [Chloroflexi bacterium]|nr:putative sulfate exporter family transporter [Chloroflexota bacterium]
MTQTETASQETPAVGNKLAGFTGGLAISGVLAIAAWWLAKQVYALELPFNIPGKVLEYPLWAAIVGLVGNAALKVFKLHETVKPGIRTELFLKIGLILLGAKINLSVLASAAGGAIIQGFIMITSVFFFSWWVSGKFGLDDKLRAVMSTALSVCGVSAAIAAAGSVLAKKEQVTYVTGLVIVFALPLMVLAPLAGSAMNLPEPIAGAWFGGNIDTTAAVVGAGTIYGETAQEVASIVKNTQNALIGLVAFLLTLYFVTHSEDDQAQRPSLRIIWERFPKFVLGFILASILFTLGWIDGGKGTPIYALKNWAFTLAFVGMGLELSVSEFKRMGWKPVLVFFIVTVFNTLLALGAAWVIFTYLMPISL